MNKILLSLSIIIATLALLAPALARAQQTNYTLEKATLATNPAGLGFGFWNNDKYSAKSMTDFGRRPFERMGFFSWSAIETSPGVYDTAKMINNLKEIHTLGSNCIMAMNNIFGPWFTKAKPSTIPKFYKQDINDPKTRAAAKKYIYTVIKEVLNQTGELMVSFDYEMMFNCNPDTPERQQLLSKWYIDAVAEARRAAADLNMAGKLKIMPIVNGSVQGSGMAARLNSPYKNHKPAKWLTDMMAVSDALAIDCYYIEVANPTSPKSILAAYEFWTKNYSLGKPVYIAEVGFSSGLTQFPQYKFKPDNAGLDKAMGTEEQQREFFKNLLPAIVKANAPGGPLNNQLRGVMFWMYSDSNAKKHGEERQHYFGFVRMDGSHKPAFDILKSGIDTIETTPATAPSLEKSRVKITPDALAAGVPSRYTNGTAYDCFYITPAQKADKATLDITLGANGTVLLYSAGKWQHSLKQTTQHTFTVALDGAPIKIYLTGEKFPADNTLKNITLKTQ